MEYKSGAVRPVESISEGWNIIKDSYWTFFLMTLVAIIIMFVASLILGGINNAITYVIAAALGGAAQNSGDAGRVSAAIIPQIISLVISVFTNIIVLTLIGSMYCGIYTALSRKADGGTADFGDLFAGFQKIMPCFIVSAVLSTVQFFIGIITLLGGAAVGISAFGAGIVKDGKLNPAIFGGLFLVIIVFVVVSLIVNLIIAALTTFVFPLIATHELSGGQALLLSVKSGFANIGGIILLLILLGLMALAGMLLCIVGVLFVAPVLTAAIFAAFRGVFGKTDDFRRYSPPSPPSFGNQPQF
jgi:hypothetical protein